MYQPLDQPYVEQKSIISNPDLLLLFDGYPNNTNTFEDSPSRKASISTSATASPPMNEKELAEHTENDELDISPNYNSRSRRTSLNKAERRAEHNAIERARRECLNSKFQQLAEALPNLQNHRRPSKGQIVEKALDWVKQNMTKEDRYQYQILQLQNENKRLLNQISMGQHEKSKSGIITPPVSSSSPVVAPFPPNLRQQQFPASSTPTTSLNTRSCSNSSGSSSGSTTRMPSYSTDSISLMLPISMDWNPQQSDFPMTAPTDYMMPSISSSSRATQQDDDEDSNSSNEESQYYSDSQLGYSNVHPYALFDMNSTLPVSNTQWDKPQLNSEYPYACSSMTF
ncbi:hypothetical protein BD560DRAFT_451749 [Blakeslea trispora]|nr:hypothetical protein BD560DRAFT_451749 [Blakeslea trispora]